MIYGRFVGQGHLLTPLEKICSLKFFGRCAGPIKTTKKHVKGTKSKKNSSNSISSAQKHTPLPTHMKPAPPRREVPFHLVRRDPHVRAREQPGQSHERAMQRRSTPLPRAAGHLQLPSKPTWMEKHARRACTRATPVRSPRGERTCESRRRQRGPGRSRGGRPAVERRAPESMQQTLRRPAHNKAGNQILRQKSTKRNTKTRYMHV